MVAGFDVIPTAMHDLSLSPRPHVVLVRAHARISLVAWFVVLVQHPFICVSQAYFVVFDSLMWMIHYAQHNIQWLYHHTHSVHHTIKSPSILVCSASSVRFEAWFELTVSWMCPRWL